MLGVLSRLVPHPWNATPVMAIALFGGTCLSKRASILVPLAIVGISDLLLGWHHTIPFTWGAFVLTAMLGWWVRRRAGVGPDRPFTSVGAGRIMAAALAGSVLFFVITNFGVWLVGKLYPLTWAGLWQCYVAAIPFFRGTLAGDVVYTAVFFGSFALVTRARPVQLTVPAK